MSNIITADYNGTQVFFQDDAYLNATAIAAHFNKKPIEWLRLPSTEEYINTLCEKAKVGKSHFVKTTRGGSNLALRGTWLHRRLAVPFARWLNVEFAIWCDEQIEKILIGQKQQQLSLPEPENNELLQLLMRIYCYGLQYSDYQRAVLGTSLNDEVGKGKLIGDFCTEGEPAQQGYLFVFTPNIEKDLQQAREIINRHVKAQHKKRTEF
uniref:Kil A-N domain n=2 Tax=Avibacterium paragallinarum TaxID=728 RepID=H6U8R3_AVIPA|nr:Kil A-N domain [Avibacterium paragallinarum]